MSDSGEHHTVLEALQELFTVISAQGIRGVELLGSQEGLETVLKAVCVLIQRLEESEAVPKNNIFVPVLILNEELNLLFQVMEEYGTGVYSVVLVNEVVVRSFPVLLELDIPILVEKVELSV